MTEAFEIGISLALRDGVSDAIAAARRDVAALDFAIRSNAVSMSQLRSAGQRLLGKDWQAERRSDEKAKPRAPDQAPEPTRPEVDAPPADVIGTRTRQADGVGTPRARGENPAPLLQFGMALPSGMARTQAQVPAWATAPTAPAHTDLTPPAGVARQPQAASLAETQRTQQALPNPAPYMPQPIIGAAPITLNIGRPSPAPKTPSPPPDAFPQVQTMPDSIMRSITRLQAGQAAPPGPAAAAPPEAAGAPPPNAAQPAPSATISGTAPSSGSADLQLAAQSAMNGDVFLDGALVGRWMCRFLARQAGRESAGPTGFDSRRNPILPGPTIGM
jgi:hypothetical protein